MKKYMVDTGVWPLLKANPKNKFFEKDEQRTLMQAIWHSILLSKSKLILLYDEVIETELKNRVNRHGFTAAVSEEAINLMKNFGKKVSSNPKSINDLEKIIKKFHGGQADKQILIDAISNDCDGIITFDGHFKSSELSSLGLDIIDLKDYDDAVKGTELINKLQS